MEILEIREAGEDGGDLMGWYTKGHVDQDIFVSEVKKYSGYESYSDFKTPRKTGVKHVFWRNVPMRGQDGCFMFQAAKEGERGAYPVTAFEFSSFHAAHTFEEEKRIRQDGRDQGQREAVNFAYRWILAVKGEKTAEEFLSAWGNNR